MISRRGFLKGMFAGAATIVAAPAICRVENLMKLYVPKQDLVLGRGLTRPIYHVDELAFFGGDYDGDVLNSFYSNQLNTQAILSAKHLESMPNMLPKLPKHPMIRRISISPNLEIANEIARTAPQRFLTRSPFTLK